MIQLEVYDKNTEVVKREKVTLMQLRVFCEQEMYPKLNSGEIGSILILNIEEDKGDDRHQQNG